MPNAWIEHVRKYAKDNNISYGCAVSEARASYVKPDKPPTKNYKRKVTPEDREKSKQVKQNILDRIEAKKPKNPEPIVEQPKMAQTQPKKIKEKSKLALKKEYQTLRDNWKQMVSYTPLDGLFLYDRPDVNIYRENLDDLITIIKENKINPKYVEQWLQLPQQEKNKIKNAIEGIYRHNGESIEASRFNESINKQRSGADERPVKPYIHYQYNGGDPDLLFRVATKYGIKY
jgi:hypothetical protein